MIKEILGKDYVEINRPANVLTEKRIQEEVDKCNQAADRRHNRCLLYNDLKFQKYIRAVATQKLWEKKVAKGDKNG